MRVSFAGGGSDFRPFAEAHGGNVIAVGLKWCVHVLIHPLSDCALERYRCSYASVESKNAISEIEHPAIRESLALLEWTSPIGIYTWSDVPSRMGLGGSSAFVVALLAALHRYRDRVMSPHELAKQAIEVERIRADEPGGEQDQYSAALGSLRHYRFGPIGLVSENRTRPDLLEVLDTQLALVSLGAETDRTATVSSYRDGADHSPFSGADQQAQSSIANALAAELSLSDIETTDALSLVGVAMRKSQEHKVALYPLTGDAVKVLELVKTAGSVGEKVCGAGGGGFVAAIVPPGGNDTFTEAIQQAGYGIFFPRTSHHGVRVTST